MSAGEVMVLSKARTPAAEAPAPDSRRHRRRTALWSAFLDTGAGAFACVLLNLSDSGAMIQLSAPLAPQQKVALVLEHFGTLEAEVVWRLADKGKAGIRFFAAPGEVARLFDGERL